MTDLRREELNRLESIRQLFGRAMRESRPLGNRHLQPEDDLRIREAMGQVVTIIDAYREGLFEQAHSVRVKCLTSDLGSFKRMLAGWGDRELTMEDEEKVRIRIKTWARETRRWVADLPMLSAAGRLPALGGMSAEARLDRLNACWAEADGACLAPPPRSPRALPNGVPKHFQPAAPWVRDPLLEADPLDRTRPKEVVPAWRPKPGPLLELLGFAEEILLVDVGGADRGGRTTFVERRRKCALRDAFAFSCVVAFERALGPKSARQSQTPRRRWRPTVFEEFILKVQEAAVGGQIPKAWTLGPDPVRRAIKVQRAWQSLFKAAGVADGSAFGSLPEEARWAAQRRLKPQIQARLRQVVVPWV